MKFLERCKRFSRWVLLCKMGKSHYLGPHACTVTATDGRRWLECVRCQNIEAITNTEIKIISSSGLQWTMWEHL